MVHRSHDQAEIWSRFGHGKCESSVEHQKEEKQEHMEAQEMSIASVKCYCCGRPLTKRYKIMVNEKGEDVTVCMNCYRMWQKVKGGKR